MLHTTPRSGLQRDVDYDETMSPIVKLSSFRPSSPRIGPWTVHQLNVKNNFLHDTLTETMYCSQPTSFVDSTRTGMVCKLNNS